MTKISTVISYCSTEKRFINECIKSAEEFSNKVIVTVGDHLFDGTPEDLSLINQNKKENPNAEFLLFSWKRGKPSRYWHNYGRYIGAKLVEDNCEWVLFLDADEIINTEVFGEFYRCLSKDVYSYWLSSYWYFRERYYRAKQRENNSVLVQSKYSTKFDLEKNEEREQLINPKSLVDVMFNGTPLIHHYSWVRTKEEMTQKVKAWGHNKDKDWLSLIEEEFSRPFNGSCFVHTDYSFEILQ